MGQFLDAAISGEKPDQSFLKAAMNPQKEETVKPQETTTQEQNKPFFQNMLEEQGISMAENILSAEGRRIKVGQGFMRIKDGLVQTSLEVLEGAGLMDKGTSQEFTRLTNEERAFVNEKFKEEYGDKFQFSVAEGSGEILPFMAIPAGGATALGRILYGMMTGAGVSGSSFVEEEDPEKRRSERINRTAVGAGVGVAATAGAELITKTRNFITNTIAKAIKTNKSFAQRGVELAKRTGIKFKLSQILGDPTIESLEAVSRSGSKGERIAREIETRQPIDVLKFFRRAQAKLAPKPGEPFGTRVQRLFDDIMGDSTKGTGLLGKRTAEAKIDFRAAKDAGGVIPATKTINALDELIEEFTSPGSGQQRLKLANELGSIRDDIVEKGAAFDPITLQHRLQEWGKAARGSGKLFSDKVDRAAELGPAKKMYRALNDDLDEAIVSGGQGAEALKQARNNYLNNTQVIREVEETALGQLFGVKGNVTLEKIEQKFINMKPTELDSVMKILNKQDPLIKKQLQRFWMKSFIDKARVQGQADAISFVPAKLLDIKKGDNLEKFNAIFSDPASRKLVNDGLEAVRRIMLNNFRTGGRTLPRLKEFAGVIASRDPTFVSRTAVDLFAPGIVTKYILDPNGVKALQELAKPVNQNRIAAAVAKLTEIGLRD